MRPFSAMGGIVEEVRESWRTQDLNETFAPHYTDRLGNGYSPAGIAIPAKPLGATLSRKRPRVAVSTQWREDGYEPGIKHMGRVRGGCNWNSRLSLQFYAADITGRGRRGLTEEFRARLNGQTNGCNRIQAKRYHRTSTRSHDEILAAAAHGSPFCGVYRRETRQLRSRHDGPRDPDPAVFWREIAYARANVFRED